MSISTSLSTLSCLTSSYDPLLRALCSPSVKRRANCHLGRLHERAIGCCSDSKGSNSNGTQGDVSELSNPRGRIAPMRSSRRELVLKSSGAAMLLAFINLGAARPEYIGVQKNPPSLALCPPTPTCISTSEELNDPAHYVPPWSYNPPDGRGRKHPASKEKAIAELIEVVQTTKPDNYTPRVVKTTDDYVYVEYESPFPLVKFVDDVEFWFPPGDSSIVEYRSASRFGQTDFDANRKRIRVHSKPIVFYIYTILPVHRGLSRCTPPEISTSFRVCCQCPVSKSSGLVITCNSKTSHLCIRCMSECSVY